ncbi:MAG TPA: septum formation family protein [Acidimicrobiales bacterium]
MAVTTCACGYNLPEGVPHCPACGRATAVARAEGGAGAGTGAGPPPDGPPGGWSTGPPPPPAGGQTWGPPPGGQTWGPPPGQTWGPPPGGQTWGPQWGPPPGGQTWGPQWGPPPGGYPQATPPSPGRGLAIAALVVGIASLFLNFVFVVGLGAVVLGAVAITQARRGAASSRRMAAAGLALGVVSLVIGVFVVGAIVHVARHYRTIATLEPGQCFNTVHGVLPHYDVVGCSSPHDAEAYGIVEAGEPSGTPYPGIGGFSVDQARCVPLRVSYVGGTLDRSRYEPIVLVPNALAWDRGVRRMVCVVRSAAGGKLIGSVRGSSGAPAA